MITGRTDCNSTVTGIDPNWRLPEKTKAKNDWYGKTKAKFKPVKGFSGYEHRKVFNSVEVRKVGAQHDLIQHWWDVNSIKHGKFVVMWKDGVKCKVDIKSDCFGKKGK